MVIYGCWTRGFDCLVIIIFPIVANLSRVQIALRIVQFCETSHANVFRGENIEERDLFLFFFSLSLYLSVFMRLSTDETSRANLFLVEEILRLKLRIKLFEQVVI